MTYEELLEAVASPTYRESRNLEMPYATLRAVLELHTHVQISPKNRDKSGLRSQCTECGFAFPCPTVEAIARELA
jgi:hypothetical protein